MPSTVQSQPMVASQSRYWWGGMDSYTIPDQLNAYEYVFGVNIVNRGGLPQTRPGSRSLYCLPSGRRQGFHIFTPISGKIHHMVAIAGRVYVSPDPFKAWTLLPGIQFAASSKYVTFTECLKSTSITNDGEPVPLDSPYRVVIMQDGRTRAAYWDGSTGAHLNPTVLPGDGTADGYDGTKIGLWSAFAGQRLWVSRGNKIFASDLGNPLKFTESEYLNELPFLALDGDCTGMIELPDKSGLLAFTERSCYLVKSSIQDRTQWSSTTDFYAPILSIGCVAPRSIVAQHGLIYWFCPAGLISLDDAVRANRTSELIPLDLEMAYSKAYIGPILSDICCAAFENYLLVSVPYCSLENTHTWVLDLATFESSQRSWNSVWTGWRPVNWFSAVVRGQQRCFFLSHDFDGRNRVWEAFLKDRQDNGCPITCSIQLRLDPIGAQERKRYGHAEIDVVQLYGEASCLAAVSSWRGWFDPIMKKEMVASTGRIRLDQTYGQGTEAAPKMGGNRPQVRTLRTTQWDIPSACNACGVESEVQNNVDSHFQLFIAWSGRMGISAIRQHATADPYPRNGDCEENKPESGFHVLMETGCGTTESEFPTTEAFAPYSDVAAVQEDNVPNVASSMYARMTATSQISQADATRKAKCHAQGQINALKGRGEDLITLSFEEGGTQVVVVSPAPELALYRDDGVTEIVAQDIVALFDDETLQLEIVIKNIGSAPLTLDPATPLGEAVAGLVVVAGPHDLVLAPGEETSVTVEAA